MLKDFKCSKVFMYRIALVLLISFGLLVSPCGGYSYEKPSSNVIHPYEFVADLFDGELAYETVKELCKDEYEGRQSGTEGGFKSAQWIASKFQEYGLEPYTEDSYMQAFEIPFFDIEKPVFLSIDKKNTTYREDYIVFPGSGSNHLTRTAVFVGPGITNPSMQYDDYENVDVTDKVVIILNDNLLPEYTPENYDSYKYQYQVDNALSHGASGIIFVSQTGSYANMIMRIMDTRFVSSLVNAPSDFPILYIREEVFDTLLSPEDSLFNICSRMYESRKSASFALSPEIEITCTTKTGNQNAQNIIGYIPSLDKTSTKSVIIGASYDHLGKDAISGEMFCGANDNASGLSVLLELSRILGQNSIISQHHIVFIAFAAGEAGSLGAQHYAENPLFPVDQIRYMINLDQVGSNLKPSWFLLTNLYTLNSTIFKALEHNCDELFTFDHEILDTTRDFHFPVTRFGIDSDPFYQRDVPFISFHNNDGAYQLLHGRLISDTPDIVSSSILQEIGQVVVGFLLHCGDFSIFHIPDLENNTRFQHPVILLSGFHKGMIKQVVWGRFDGALKEVGNQFKEKV